MATTATLAAPTGALVDTFHLLRTELESEVFEREDEIYGLLAAIIARTHVFQYGPPGIGKSYLLDRLMLRIAANKFKTLMHGAMKPEEMFGPLDLGLLEQSRYSRLVDGYLPSAHVAMLTEIWKGNETILNALLLIANEREFFNDGANQHVPLSTIVCDSNEFPKSGVLAAIYDRIPLRYYPKPLKDKATRIKALTFEPDPNPKVLLTWDDVVQAQREAHALAVSPDVPEAMVKLQDGLRDKNIEVTDRRLGIMLRVLKAVAWLDGSPTVEVDHLPILQHGLWDHVDDIAEVQKQVLAFANPLENDIQALFKLADQISADIDLAVQHADTKVAQGSQIHITLERARNERTDLEAKVGNSRRSKDQLAALKTRFHELTARMITEIFELPLDQLDKLFGSNN